MKTSDSTFSITRDFKAPVHLVFDAFSTVQALEKWWGPAEAPIEVLKLDFREDGIFHFKMNGEHTSYGVFSYLEVNRPDRLSWISSFADENGEVIRPPFEGIEVPREILNEVSFSEKDGVTTLVLISRPVNASQQEEDTFNDIKESMEGGYGGTFDQLSTYLDSLKDEKG